MNILITGDLSSLSICLATRFSKEGHRVILAGSDPGFQTAEPPRVTFHSISVGDVLFPKTISRYRFDAVVFFGSREECLGTAVGLASGEMLDGLSNTLEMVKNDKLDQFFFVSSTEIYGNLQETEEGVQVDPISVNGYALTSAEEICQYYQHEYSLGLTICRIPHLYGLEGDNGFLPKLVDQFHKKSKITMPGRQDTKIDFLHCLDLAEFILLALTKSDRQRSQLFNLSSAGPMTMGDLAALINDHFPAVTVNFNQENLILTRTVNSIKAREALRWIPKHTIERDLPTLLEAWRPDSESKKSGFKKISQKLGVLKPVVRWIELLAGAGGVYYLTSLTKTILQFRYIDFRLLYVVLLGATHGTAFGLIAAVIASGLALLSWYEKGSNFSMLIYNVENWIPFALYLLAGGITGYLHDKHENEIRFQQEQVELIQEKYKFLYGVYDEISSIKDQFREQLMGYRDSFGRIYHVTTQLNSLQEEDIMLSALGVLEDVLENDSIAIYSLDENQVFGRLQVCSQPLRASLPKSIKLQDFPELISKIGEGEVYQNNEIKPDYPTYFAPILDGETPVAGIAIWDASFEQFSLQYYNLVKVITGLIQSALVRAALFKHANADKLYLPNTRILKSDAFKEILSAKSKMETSQVAEYEVIRILNEFDDVEKASLLMESGIRTTDYIGVLEDGQCYILLSQTDWLNAFNVLSRLHNVGIDGEICTEAVLDA